MVLNAISVISYFDSKTNSHFFHYRPLDEEIETIYSFDSPIDANVYYKKSISKHPVIPGVQIGIIKQRHYAKATEEGLNTADLMMENIHWMDTTDAQGKYNLNLLQGHEYTIVLKKEGYKDKKCPSRKRALR